MANKYDEIMKKLGGYYQDPSEVWEARGIPFESLPVHQTLDDAHLDRVEAELGYPLPDDYREFLRDYGGYKFRHACFPLWRGKQESAEIYAFMESRDERTLADDFHKVRSNWGTTDGEDWDKGMRLVRDIQEPLVWLEWPEELLPIAVTPH